MAELTSAEIALLRSGDETISPLIHIYIPRHRAFSLSRKLRATITRKKKKQRSGMHARGNGRSAPLAKSNFCHSAALGPARMYANFVGIVSARARCWFPLVSDGHKKSRSNSPRARSSGYSAAIFIFLARSPCIYVYTPTKGPRSSSSSSSRRAYIHTRGGLLPFTRARAIIERARNGRQ